LTLKVDLAEFLTAYVAEVDEQLAIASAKALLIESSAQKGARQPRAVRDLFRAMHTVKGLSSMVGIEPIVVVSHKVETLLREADRAGGAVASRTVDVILQSVRFIEKCVRAAEKSGPAPEPPPPLLEALAEIAPDDEPRSAGGARLTLEPALEKKLDAFERQLLVSGAREGRRAIRIDYVPTSSGAAQGLNINGVRERLGAVAEVVRVLPLSVAPTDRAPGGIAFALLVLTSRSDEEVAAATGLDPATIRSIVRIDEGPKVPAVRAPDDEELGEPEPEADDGQRRNLLRVDVARVDDAMERLASLIVTRSRLAREIAALGERGADTRELARIAQENSRQLRDLRASILQVRMVPLAEVLDRVPLILRALTRTSGREVRLQIEGAGAELDKAVAERIFPAIVHLVRNAVDHGIEPAAERERHGKRREGTIRIECSARSNTRLELAVHDDGRGIDGAAVARRADASPPESNAALLELLCTPGFSTRDEATTTSGRGLGMDIVRHIVVGQLGGELSMQTAVGRGTTFIVQIPLTVAILDGFVVECSGDRFIVPVSVVEEILDVDPDRLVLPPRGSAAAPGLVGMVQRRGETLPLYSLAVLLGFAPGSGAARRGLVVRVAGEPLGFLLDRVRGQQEAVVRPLLDPLVRVPGVSAATDLGDGRPTLVLDLVGLSGLGRRAVAARAAPAARLPAAEPGAMGGPS
jgi:two-component system, chemotaxis family, sensor kinase CheA